MNPYMQEVFGIQESDYNLLDLYDAGSQSFNTSKKYDAYMDYVSTLNSSQRSHSRTKQYQKRGMVKTYDKQLNKLRDRGFSDAEIFEYLSDVQSNPDKYLGGSQYLPKHMMSKRSKRYSVEGDMDIYMDKLLIYADEAARLYGREQEQAQAAMAEEKSLRKQQEFDYKSEQLSDFEQNAKRYDMSENERAQQASDAYLDSKTRQYTATGQPKNPYGVMILPQDRPV